MLLHDGIDLATVIPPGCKTGLIQRDRTAYPQGCYAWAAAMPDSELIPQSEWADRWAEKEKNQSSLLHLRNDNYDLLKSLDQNGYGLCWAFSTTKAVMYVRAVNNQPGVRLSGYYTAGKVKGWRDQGGWGAESLQQACTGGIATLDQCPSYSSRYDNPTVDADASKHVVSEWWDGSDDPNKAQQQLISMLLKDIPCVVDLNVMGHSMCAVWFTLNPLTIIYDNSWGEQGDRGLYRGQGAYARPDGLVVPRVVKASM